MLVSSSSRYFVLTIRFLSSHLLLLLVDLVNASTLLFMHSKSDRGIVSNLAQSRDLLCVRIACQIFDDKDRMILFRVCVEFPYCTLHS